MPLRAKFDGQDKIATLINDIEWEEIKEIISSNKNLLILPCCEALAYLRISKLGTKHFVHRKKSSCQFYENDEILKMKNDIVIACSSCNYKVKTEVSYPEWSADVLAIKDKIKIAFEVSHKPLNKVLEIQETYRKNGIRGCWFFKEKFREKIYPKKELPIFYISIDKNNNINVLLNDKYINLIEFVKLLLSGQIKFSQKLVSKSQQEIRIIFFEMICWKCKKISHIYFLEKNNKISYISKCGVVMAKKQEIPRQEDSLQEEFKNEVITTVMNYVKSEEGKKLRIGSIEPRYSKSKGESYISFGCYWCASIIGKPFIDKAIMRIKSRNFFNEKIIIDKPNISIKSKITEYSVSAILETNLMLSEPIIIDKPHWCYSKNGEYCNNSI
ncbi:MAG: hypothetical protein ABRQ39_30395 [Candidatus Eremiobacterota bacterium]